MIPLSRHSRRRRGVAALAIAAFGLSAATVAHAAESGSSATAPANPTPSYASVAADYTAGSSSYSFTRNATVRANVGTKVANNQAQGTYFAGWPADIYRVDANARETLDWTQGVIVDAPAAAYEFPGKGLNMPSVAQAGGTVTASGGWLGGDLSTFATYTALGDAPIVKVRLTLSNPGDTAVTDKVFGYVMDPDESSPSSAAGQTAILPGVGVNPNAIVTEGWSANFTYQGPNSSSINSPGHGIAWLDDAPVAVYPRNDGSSYSSVWWPVDVAAGGSQTITFYHIVEAPSPGTGEEVAAGVGAWAAQLAELDTAGEGEVDPPEVAMVSGRVSGPGGVGVAGVTISARNVDATLATTAVTGSDGQYTMVVPVGTYTLTATKLGYTDDSRSVEATAGGAFTLDFEVAAVVTSASRNRELDGAVAEGGPDDIVIENSQLAMAIANAFLDPQLAGAGKGKVIDMAATGFNDGIDWLNGGFLAATEPTGDAWQQFNVIVDTVDIIEPGGPTRALVRTTGHSTVFPDVTVVTDYVIEPGDSYVTATTTFANAGANEVVGYTGEALDVDEGTTTTFAPGTASFPTLTTITPDEPWFAQWGGQQQTFGVVYTDGLDVKITATNAWAVAHGQVVIPANGSASYTRRLVVGSTVDVSDRAAPVRHVWEEVLAESVGLLADLDVADTELSNGESTTAAVTITNSSDAVIDDATLTVAPGTLILAGPATVAVPALAPDESTTIPFELTAETGGSTTVSVDLNRDGQRLRTLTAKLFVDGPGWYLGDNHTHSVHSDGSGTIAQNMASGRSKGLSFVTATDHNTVNQRNDLPAEQRTDFVALYGEEVTRGDGHSLAYNISSLITTGGTYQDVLDRVNANNDGEAFLYIAHPYYPGLEWDHWDQIDGLRGIEVWNGFYPPKHTVNANAFAKWDELNRAGHHLYGIANSDAHNPGKVGDPMVRAYLDTLDRESIVAALGSGYMYGTDGVDITFTVGGVRMGGDLPVPASGGEVLVELGATYSANISEVRLLVDGEVVETFNPNAATFEHSVTLDLAPGQFVRMEADAANGRFAFSNPVWATDGWEPDPDSDELTVSVNVPEVVEPGEFVWSISGESRTVNLTEATNEGTYLHSTGELIPIIVTDTRVGGPAWSVTGRVSNFTNGVSGKYLGWTPAVESPGAGAVPGAPVAPGIDAGNGLTDAALLAAATDGHAGGTATLGADFDLRLPVDTPAGTYTSTLTITALS